MSPVAGRQNQAVPQRNGGYQRTLGGIRHADSAWRQALHAHLPPDHRTIDSADKFPLEHLLNRPVEMIRSLKIKGGRIVAKTPTEKHVHLLTTGIGLIYFARLSKDSCITDRMKI